MNPAPFVVMFFAVTRGHSLPHVDSHKCHPENKPDWVRNYVGWQRRAPCSLMQPVGYLLVMCHMTTPTGLEKRGVMWWHIMGRHPLDTTLGQNYVGGQPWVTCHKKASWLNGVSVCEWGCLVVAKSITVDNDIIWLWSHVFLCIIIPFSKKRNWAVVTGLFWLCHCRVERKAVWCWKRRRASESCVACPIRCTASFSALLLKSLHVWQDEVIWWMYSSLLSSWLALILRLLEALWCQCVLDFLWRQSNHSSTASG